MSNLFHSPKISSELDALWENLMQPKSNTANSILEFLRFSSTETHQRTI